MEGVGDVVVVFLGINGKVLVVSVWTNTLSVRLLEGLSGNVTVWIRKSIKKSLELSIFACRSASLR
jgi:hypothetical protein